MKARPGYESEQAVIALMIRHLGEMARLERLPNAGGILEQPGSYMDVLFAVQAAYSEFLSKRR